MNDSKLVHVHNQKERRDRLIPLLFCGFAVGSGKSRGGLPVDTNEIDDLRRCRKVQENTYADTGT